MALEIRGCVGEDFERGDDRAKEEGDFGRQDDLLHDPDTIPLVLSAIFTVFRALQLTHWQRLRSAMAFIVMPRREGLLSSGVDNGWTSPARRRRKQNARRIRFADDEPRAAELLASSST
jgi:hypothetical protein